MNIKEKLMNIQAELKAPKDLDNNFGKYKYRSAESILEALKPLLKKQETTLNLTDSIAFVGDRYYIESTAILSDTKSEETIIVKAYAREEESKKGMDSSQVTGAASSYARKYALNGLFAIDDNKDSDYTNDKKDEPEQKQPPKPAPKQPQQKPEADKPQQAATAIPPKIAEVPKQEVKQTPFVKPIEKTVEQPNPPEPICDDCKQTIIDHKNTKGILYTVADLLEGSKRDYNAKLCFACSNKRFIEKKATQQVKK